MAKTVKLNTGASIPLLGLGTVAITEAHEQVKAAILTAIEVGYRHFDTAELYGTEAPLGDALSEAFKSGLVKREEVFVTTKLWCTHYEPEDVLPTLQKSLRTLQLDYVDLYLMHWPLQLKKDTELLSSTKMDVLPTVDFKSVWLELEQGVHRGLTKAIGVSNFSVKKLGDLLSYATIPPAVNQVEMSVCWQQKQLLDYCTSKGIHITAYCPLGAPGTPYSTLSGTVLNNPALEDIAKLHGKTTAQVALRWIVESGASAVPKSYNPSRLLQNISIFNWCLTEEDHKKIAASLPQQRGVTGENFVGVNSPYKTIQELWDSEV